jgi:ubiquinone/menaquinone biosynthesis C-methylase UbiE
VSDAPSLDHLLAHHRDFTAFKDAMIESSAGRFGPLWWGLWGQHVQPPAGATLVDLGTGPGLLLPRLRAHHPDARIIGVEVQPEMLDHARGVAAGCGAELVEADLARPIPLADGVADVVTAVMVFHELPHPPPLLHEIARLLKPGGVMVLYDWVKRPLREYLDAPDALLDEDKLQHFREHCLFAPDDLAFLAERAGLDVVEVVLRRGGHFAIVVARKPAG